MGLSVKNSGKLRQRALVLREAPRRVQADAARQIKRDVYDLLDWQFESKISTADGSRWKPPKDGGETLERSGRLRRGFKVEVVPSGAGLSLRISNREEYAKWLNRGTDKMVARRLVPGARLPEEYRRVFEQAYREALEKWWASATRR